MIYTYKVVPAPTKGLKAKGLKTTADRFCLAFEMTINEYAKDGWEFVRAETLPSEEREGLMGRTTTYQNVLVFRRTAKTEDKVEIPRILPPPIDNSDAHSNNAAAEGLKGTEMSTMDQIGTEASDKFDS